MSAAFTAIQAIGYGFELCGTYTPDECSKEEPKRLPLLSNAQRLMAYADSARGLHGVEQARSAARYVLDNSASVKEAEIAMMFILPRSKDGFAVKRPKLNYCISCDPEDETLVSYDGFEIDMFWIDAGVGMEVQSEKHHGVLAGGGYKWVKDARRRNTLQFFGNTIIEATPGDYGSALGLPGLARQVCELAGFRSITGQFDVGLSQLSLYDEVFALSNYP